MKFFFCKYLVWASWGISFLSFYQVVWFFFIFSSGIYVSLYGWFVWLFFIFTSGIYVSLIVSSCMIFMYFYLGYFPQLLIQLKEATQYAPFDPLHHLHKPFFIKNCVHDIMTSSSNSTTIAWFLQEMNAPLLTSCLVKIDPPC